MKKQVMLLLLAVLFSCRTTNRKEAKAHVKFAPTFEPSVCMVSKASRPELKVCFSGTDSAEKKSESIRSLQMWQKAVMSKYVQAIATFVENCDNPDVNVNIWDGYATPVTQMTNPPHVQIYTQTEFGNVIHEFGHAYACLGDTYVGNSAGYCQGGQPKSIMCYGMLLNDITEDDVAGVRDQYERLGLDKKDLNPEGDDDKDSIKNFEDKCPHTPECVVDKDKKPTEQGKIDCEKPTVWKSRDAANLKWLGCALGETPMF